MIQQTKQIASRTWQTVRAAFSRVYTAVMVFGPGSELFSRYNKERLIRETYERNPYMKATADMAAKGVAGLPRKILIDGKPLPDGKRHEVEMVFDQLEDGIDGLIKKFVLYYKITGDSYIQMVTNFHEIVDNNFKFIPPKTDAELQQMKLTDMIVWPSQHMNPVQGSPAVPILGYKFRDTGGTVTLAKWEIIHWKTASLTEYWHGMPPATPLSEIIDMSNNYILWNLNMARREGRPSMIAKVKGHTPTPKQIEEIQENWKKHQGPEGVGSLPVIGDVDLVNMNQSPAEANWLEGDKHAGRLVAMGMETPSELINDAQNKTYNNQREAEKAYYLRNLIPTGKEMFQVISRGLQQFYPGLSIEVDVEAIDAISENQLEKQQRVGGAFREGIITRHEAREELGKGTDGVPNLLINPSGTRIELTQAAAKHGIGYNDLIQALVRGDDVPNELLKEVRDILGLENHTQTMTS